MTGLDPVMGTSTYQWLFGFFTIGLPVGLLLLIVVMILLGRHHPRA